VDTATLKAYRDALDDDPALNRTSVNTYMTPLRTLFKWAVNEGYTETDPTLGVQTLNDKRTIEDRQWKPFNDSQIRTVWNVVQEGWGPEGTSRLSEPRRATFLMVFRVLLWTGMRPAEVFILTPDDGLEDRIDAKETKTGPRTVALADAIKDFPAFIASDTWSTPMKEEKWGNGNVTNLQRTISESFTKLIRDAGLNNPKHVLYNTTRQANTATQTPLTRYSTPQNS
jgi:integrase